MKNCRYNWLMIGSPLITPLELQCFPIEVIPVSFPLLVSSWGSSVNFFLFFYKLRVAGSSWCFRRVTPVSERRMDGRRDWRRELNWGQMTNLGKLTELECHMSRARYGSSQDSSALCRCGLWRRVEYKGIGSCWDWGDFGTFRESAQRQLLKGLVSVKGLGFIS